jgi:superfamily II DNA or RNA helicase
MSETTRELAERLLPHQAAFVESVSVPEGPRLVVLCGDPGTGKTIALVALTARVLSDRPDARILLLGPASLGPYWVDVLVRYGASAQRVDRYRFREMLDARSNDEMWTPGTVFVLSTDFARQVDISDSLTSTHWDLVIADEAHHFRGARAELLMRIKPVADRLVLATMPTSDLPSQTQFEDAVVVQWQRDQLVDRNGKSLAQPRPVLREVYFGETPAEESLFEGVYNLSMLLEKATPAPRLIAKLLRRALHSSPAALEGALRQYVTRVDLEEELLDGPEENEIAREAAAAIAGATIDSPESDFREHVGFLLSELEALKNDSKLDALKALIGGLAPRELLPRSICVLTEFSSTLHYLAAGLGEYGLACQMLHGGLREEARQDALSVIKRTGGILLATRAVMTEGTSLPNVSDLVLYDLPSNKFTFQNVLGRFDRLGRNSVLTVHALRPAKPANEEVIESLRFLRILLK